MSERHVDGQGPSGERGGGALRDGTGRRTGRLAHPVSGDAGRTSAPLATGTGGAPEASDGPDAPDVSDTGTARAARAARRGGRGRARAWAELLRVPALFTVPGDALAGTAATGTRPGTRTLLAIGSSLCLYEAGMALNDWADRAEDARDRPHRPLPSGRVRPAAALTAACALTGAGLALAARAGRPALAVAAPLAATVWSYDLGLKHTPAGPAAMAAARGLDLLLGAAAGGGRTRAALPSAALLAGHTLAVTTVSRREAQGGSSAGPLAALAASALLTALLTRRPAPPLSRQAAESWQTAAPRQAAESRQTAALRTALGAAYAATVARPYLHAALNPSPPLTQRAVGGGIRATIPLQAALCARAGARVTALAVAALAPVGRACARKVSIT
ncbi:SCO3242 family prenyltransferase [Streptomyces sp. JB150]|uniref:SCO3242 family prenyltransferase n=1 Tax=Streptomyces sp. JB150 TaxID=2714844 RepID=UPI001409443D|nr:UbiA family prenyltransferase [Streptomyces sp. JB150]QIJ65663.1 UbiA family prenyltransferase [Streptomyces sp. JB150]